MSLRDKSVFLPEDHPLLCVERVKWAMGLEVVAGVDEAGRGPLAGPLVVAAVAFRPGSAIPPVDDSKKLSPAQREELRQAIANTPGVVYSIQTIPPETIDRINILEATRMGMRKAVKAIRGVQFALIDGLPVPDFPVESEAIVKGDAKSASIAAASILAKTYRDKLMMKYSRNYPEYGFDSNMGYGTRVHLDAIARYGISPIHRKSFAPVRNALNPAPVQMEMEL
ncbi:MAG: ribonuclease HII [Victivallales bacterium]|nr:ribonuclease HII [Victivallales bacterium]